MMSIPVRLILSTGFGSSCWVAANATLETEYMPPIGHLLWLDLPSGKEPLSVAYPIIGVQQTAYRELVKISLIADEFTVHRLKKLGWSTTVSVDANRRLR